MATNNAINTPQITLGGAFTMTGGAFTFVGTLSGNTTVTFPTTGTLLSSANYPAPGATAGKVIISDGVNWIASTSIFPNTVGASGKILISDGTSNVYSTPTYPNASVTAGKVIISDGTNYIASTPTFPNASAASGKFIRSDGTNWIASTPTLPTTAGTAGKILQSDGTNFVESTATYPAIAGTAGTILRSNGTNIVNSTATFADTYTASNLLYSNGANAVTGLATANSSVLVTDVSGVPSLSTTLPAFTTSSITFNPTTGGIVGTTTNDNADSGKVGEYISSVVASPGVSLVSNTGKNVTSISLTAGDWDVWGTIWSAPAGGTLITVFLTGINTTTDTVATTPSDNTSTSQTFPNMPAGNNPIQTINPCRISINTTTTVYLVAQIVFSVSTCTAYGTISARRVR